MVEERREALRSVLDELEDPEQDVRITFADVPEDRWERLDGEWVRRYPTGDVKRNRLAPGFLVEWERGQE